MEFVKIDLDNYVSRKLAILIDFPEKSAYAPHEVLPRSNKLCPRGFFIFPFLLVFQYIICFCCKMKYWAVINIIG